MQQRIGMVNGNPPFWDICLLGMSKDIRGYQVDQFRDDRTLVGQAEYRRELFWNLGVVAFAGAGAVGETFDQFGNAEPGGGLVSDTYWTRRTMSICDSIMPGETIVTRRT